MAEQRAASSNGRARSRSDGDENTLVRPSTASSSLSSMTRDSGTVEMTVSGKRGELMARLEIESKIKEGAENMLQVLEHKAFNDHKETNRRKQVESELDAVNLKIARIQSEMGALPPPSGDGQKSVRPNGKYRAAGQFVEGPALSSVPNDPVVLTDENESASSTWSLADLLQDLDEEGRDADFYIHRANSVVTLFKRYPALKFDLAWSAFGPVLQFLLRHNKSEVSAAGYRVARYSLTDLQSIQILHSFQIDYFIVHTLGKDSSVIIDREQALRLVRAFLDIPKGISQIGKGVVRSIVACAEYVDDKLRSFCVETLAEMLVAGPQVVLSAGGDRVLTHVLSEGPPELASCVIHAYLHLLDHPYTRRYIRAGTDLESVLAPLTDGQHRMHSHEDRVRSSAVALGCMLPSWSGLLVLCMYDMKSLKAIVQSLKVSSTQIREALMDLILSALRIKAPPWSVSYLAGRRLTTFGRAGPLKRTQTDVQKKSKTIYQETAVRHDLVKQYTSLLLSTLIQAGLVETLAYLMTETDASHSRKATFLLSELLELASKSIPPKQNYQIQGIAQLFCTAASFDKTDRFASTSAVYQMDSIYRTNTRSLPSKQLIEDTSSGTGNTRVMENVKLKLSSQIDDAQFRTLLMETQVLNTGNHTKWKWDLLSELLHGPLMNPKRLDEAIRVTKFMKRLVSFYRPFKHRFSDIKNTKPNQRYVRVGCQLITTLLASADGVKYLSDNKLLRQISECLAQLDPMSGITSADPLFSKARLEETLSSGYFAMLGTLSGDPNGMAMIERWKMFNMLYHISELRSRNDMVIKLLLAFNYHQHGHPRIILAKSLTSGQKDVRMVLTRHLGTLIDESKSTSEDDTSMWAIRLLVTQLYDPDIEVCECAVRLLDQLCVSISNLQFLVACRPTLDHLGQIGAPLLLRFLSTSVGFHYLQEVDYIEREMDDWLHGRNEHYVLVVEAALARAFDGFGEKDRVGCPVPPHFYGELAKTTEGCEILWRRGHVEQFAKYIAEYREDRPEDSDIDEILKIKACLWAVGNIGATPGGVPLLESGEIVESIIRIGQTSRICSLKGTAFFVLGLLSSTPLGQQILEENGWIGLSSILEGPTGIALPREIQSFVTLPPWEFDIGADPVDKTLPKDIHPVDESVLAAISNLNNHILANEASKQLAVLRATQEERFQDEGLHERVMHLLETYRYRQPIRRFILGLFDPALGARP